MDTKTEDVHRDLDDQGHADGKCSKSSPIWRTAGAYMLECQALITTPEWKITVLWALTSYIFLLRCL